MAPWHLVWREGMGEWARAETVAGLFAPGTVPPPVPVQPVAYASPVGAPQGIGQSAGMRWVMPVGRSGWAIAAGYLGLLSFFGGCLGPVAIVAAVLAFREMKADPGKHGMGRAVFGLVAGVLGTLMLVGVVVVIVLRA